MAGEIGWIDMTTGDAQGVRDFYQAVAGWRSDPVDMDGGPSKGGYQDYVMMSGETAIGGICHAIGSNADMPPGWLLYVTVDDLDASVTATLEHGGEIVVPPRDMGAARLAVVRDPGGSTVALYQGDSSGS